MDIFDLIRLNLPSEVQKEIDSGANLEQCNDRGIKPIVQALETASLSGDATILRLLRTAGASPEPLARAIESKLDELSQNLIHEHNSTSECINGAVSVLQGRMGVSLRTKITEHRLFFILRIHSGERRRRCMTACPPLRAKWSQQGEDILGEVIGYLGEVTKLGIDGMRNPNGICRDRTELRAEAVTRASSGMLDRVRLPKGSKKASPRTNPRAWSLSSPQRRQQRKSIS